LNLAVVPFPLMLHTEAVSIRSVRLFIAEPGCTEDPMIRKLRNALLAQAVLACLMPLTLSAQNLLANPGIEKPAQGVAPGTPVAFTNFCCGAGFRRC